jgi:hypothetical protein
MSDNFTDLEQRLIRGYREQLQHYNRAIAIVEQAARKAATDGARLPWLHDLNAVLSEISALDAALTEERSVWRFGGRSPGDELRGLLDGVAERIRTLATHVDLQMQELQTRRQNLMPEMDEFIQQRRMLHAYGKRR